MTPSPAEPIRQLLYPLAREQLLQTLLHGFDSSHRPTQSQLSACGLRFERGEFCVAVCRLPGAEAEREGLCSGESLESALEKLLGDLCRAHIWVQTGDVLRILIDLDTRVPLQSCAAQLRQALSSLLNLSSPLLMGVGTAVNSLERISLSAQQADIALQYAAMHERMELIFYRDSLRSYCKKSEDLPTERKKLAAHVKKRNQRQAHAILNRILFSLPTQHSLFDLRLLYTELCAIILLSANPQRAPAVRAHALSELFSITELFQVKIRLDAMIDELCVPMLDPRGKDKTDTKILEFIDRNLLEPTLSLSSVAEQFGRSSSYISTLFKTEKGLNYIEYVNRYRISQAAKLLFHQSVPVCQVYHAVGYVSQSTFHRNFLKYTNQTPGEYLRKTAAAPL